LAAVQDSSGKWGYINRNGSLVIPCRWTSARSFTRGTAAVEEAPGIFCHIDRQGNRKSLSFLRRLLGRFWP